MGQAKKAPVKVQMKKILSKVYHERKERVHMNDLVFLKPNCIKAIPFTTSKIIAEFTGVEHRKIKVSIAKNKTALETFGLLASYGAESTGGRPEEITSLNEPQATLLVTFLKNTPTVVEFKTELVRQFYAMRTELQHRQIGREQLKPIRRELTDVIQDNPNHNIWDFKIYTDLAYKFVIGKNAAQIRVDRGACKTAKAIDYMTSIEISKVARIESQISVLCEMGLGYYQIKAMLLNRQMIGKIA